MDCFSWRRSMQLDRAESDAPVDEPSPDPYFESTFVVGLNKENFESFLKSKDLTLVMFYHPKIEMSDFSKIHFAKAAEKTKRHKHAYAAVNCEDNPAVCCNQNVRLLPYFKLYSRHHVVGFNDNPKLFQHEDMKKWVESMRVYDVMGTKLYHMHD